MLAAQLMLNSMDACNGAPEGLSVAGEPRAHAVSMEPPDVRKAVSVVAFDEPAEGRVRRCFDGGKNNLSGANGL